MNRNVRCVFTGPFTAQLEAGEPTRPPDAGQVRIRTRYSLISPGTELALYTHAHVGFKDPANTWAKYPFYPGYAAVGEVLDAGPDVRGLGAGQLVYFRGRHESLATVAADLAAVTPLPAGLKAEHAPFARLAQIANTALALSRPAVGLDVAVIGLGLVGNLAAQLYRQAGARVLAVDPQEARCRIARACGLTDILQAAMPEAVESARAWSAGKGAPIVVEATGNPTLVPAALAMAARLGEALLLGSPRGPIEIDIYTLIHRSGVALKGAHESLVPPVALDGALDQRAVARRMLDLITGGAISVAPLLTDIIAPHELPAAYDRLRGAEGRSLGVLVDWSRLEAP